MGDLSIENMEQCKKLSEEPSSKIRDYQQYYGDREDYCSCKAFKFGKGNCKHLIEGRSLGYDLPQCDYHQLIDGPPEVDGVCPKCGGPTEHVLVGV